jgi:hypothetical protein
MNNRYRHSTLGAALVAVIVSACAGPPGEGPDGAIADTASRQDANGVDVGARVDVPVAPDASAPDASAPDASAPDANTRDTGMVPPGDSGRPPGRSYSTTFPTDESPVSESRNWVNNGLDWTLVNTSGGLAFGTQGNGGAYDDSYAHLTGAWSPNQEASAVVHKAGTSGLMEVELHLRVTDGPHSVTLYEVNFAHDGAYVDFIRWRGPLGTRLSDFTYLVPTGTFHVSGGVRDGDTLTARIVGNVITAYVNGMSVGTATDTAGPGGGAVLTGGSPGMGFFRAGGAALSNYCFTSFSARDL